MKTNRSLGARLATLVTALLALGTVIMLALNLLQLFAPDTWLADTFVHFRVQYLVIAGFVLVWSLVGRHWWLILTACLVVALNAGPVYQFFSAPPMKSEIAGGKPFRVVVANVYKHNENYEDIAGIIETAKADLVVLLEATQALKSFLAKRNLYSYELMAADPPSWGPLMLSRYPIEKLITAQSQKTTGLVARVQRPSGPLHVMGIHASWPIIKTGWVARNEQQIELAKFLGDQTEPSIAMGDFNNSRFSASFQRMLQADNLQNSWTGRGWMPTWPTFFLPAGIQIDHVITNDKIALTDIKSGTGIGSDHYWIVADLLIP